MTRDWDQRADELSAEAIGGGEPTAWFDRLYAEGLAGEISVPWDREDPNPQLEAWAETVGLEGAGRTAVVVGCGLGADAEFLATLGFETTGFDIAPAAIEEARRRHPDSGVRYRVEDSFDVPSTPVEGLAATSAAWVNDKIDPNEGTLRICTDAYLIAVDVESPDGSRDPDTMRDQSVALAEVVLATLG